MRGVVAVVLTAVLLLLALLVVAVALQMVQPAHPPKQSTHKLN